MIVRKDPYDADVLHFYEKTKGLFSNIETEWCLFSCHIDHFSDEKFAKHMATNKKAEIEVKIKIC